MTTTHFGPENDTLVSLLTADTLSAMMRSTWTWDDRALRRELSRVLVSVDAAVSAVDRAHSDDIELVRAAEPLLISATIADAVAFITEVLGAKLTADTGNKFRGPVLDYALTPGHGSPVCDPVSRARDHASLATLALSARAVARDTPLTPDDTSDAAALARTMHRGGYEVTSTSHFSSIALAAQTVAATGRSDAARRYLDRLSAGAEATLAAAEATGSWDPALVKTRAANADGTWTLSGEKQFVPNATDGSILFVIARSTAGPSLFAVEPGAPGVSIRPMHVLDDSRPLARVVLDGTPATIVGREGSGGRLMNRAVDLVTTALAGEQIGVIDRCLDLLAQMPTDPSDRLARAVFESEYAQAELDLTSAKSSWRGAVALIESDTPQAAVAAAMAHINCSTAARATADLTLRIMGAGVGADVLGPEHLANRLYRRALSSELIFGGPALSHERLLERLGL